jgi:M6 family metalloprotease-like protein
MKYVAPILCAAALLLCGGAGAQRVNEFSGVGSVRKQPIHVDSVVVVNGTTNVQQRPKHVGSLSTSALNGKGVKQIPVVMAQFTDLSFTEGSAKAYEGFFNTDAVSVAQYFKDQSDGQFEPQFKVIGPVTLPQSYAYYGKNRSTSRDVNIKQFYQDALAAAQKIYSDWTPFDNNSDGKVDMVLFIFAGPGENEDGTTTDAIWPKESVSSLTVGDVTFASYAVCCELYQNKMDGIGTVCHELGHALGLPDFYDVDDNYFGMDYWDVMASGDYNYNGYLPCGFTSYEKEFMEWQTLTVLDPEKDAGIYTLKPLSEGGTGYKIMSPSGKSNEYYILENRQNTKWDEWIGYSTKVYGKHHGMLVLDVKYDYSAWVGNRVNTQPTQRMTILPADGNLFSYTNDVSTYDDMINYYLPSMAGDPYPGTQNVTEIEALQVHDITELEDGSITFRLGEMPTTCAVPTVMMNEGKLQFECTTPNAEIHYTVKDVSLEQASFDGDTFTIPNRTLRVTVYATADGYGQSDTATYDIVLQKEDVNGDGEVTVADITKIADTILHQE